MKNLKDAREFCFQYFFHLQLPIFEGIKEELQDTDNNESLINSINEYKQTTNHLFDNDINNLIVDRIQGTLINYDALEEKISEYLKNWKIERLSKVDHTNLLLSTYELCFEQQTPKNVIINEAIEISKKFGTKESAAFINGILDNMAKEVREN